MKKTFIIFAFTLLILSCKKDNKIPTANAGNDQSVNEGETVSLDGSASSDKDGDALSYKWTAPLGITLSSETEAQQTFTAPEVTSDTPYTLSLIVNDGNDYSLTDEVVITITNEDKFLSFITAGHTEGIGIKYVDIVPDEKMERSYSTKYLDLNNDSINDFELIYHNRNVMPSTYLNYLTITPLGENSVCVLKSKTDRINALAYGDTIGTNNNWSNSVSILFMYRRYTYRDNTGQDVSEGDPIGDWYDHDNIYMGVKIIKDGKEFYGWIDVNYQSNPENTAYTYKEVVVRRYAISQQY